jgi:peptidoglycan/xylan/chitin deacetylase (PgdA/CDA1 family)
MPSALRTSARAAADLVLSSARLRRVALRSAATRQRAAVLLWHRVAPEGPQPHEVVPTVALARFREQLDLLMELGAVVPLAALDDASGSGGRPRFALTFDDDDARHAHHVLPALVERDLPATFFLSGRWLHGRGPYWWELLEQDLARDGAEAVAARHGLSPGLPAARIGQALTGSPVAQELADRARADGEPPMTQEQAATLLDAGMEIGFHTIDHEVLPALGETPLRAAVSAGREELATAMGTPLERFAYPHGRADDRTSVAVARAGYRSAWTTTKRTARPGDAPMLRGRWDLGHRSLSEMRQILVRGLARPTP